MKFGHELLALEKDCPPEYRQQFLKYKQVGCHGVSDCGMVLSIIRSYCPVTLRIYNRCSSVQLKKAIKRIRNAGGDPSLDSPEERQFLALLNAEVAAVNR